MPNQYLFYECNVFVGNERGVNVGMEYIRSQIDMNEQEKSFCKAHFFNYTRENILNYSTIRQLLINGDYKPLKDFVQLKPIPYKKIWNDNL